MLTMEEVMELKVLRKQGYSIRQIVRETGLSRNTVKKYLEPNDPPARKARGQRRSKLDAYKAYIGQRQEQAKPHWIPATVIYREILAMGYQGKERIVRQYLSSLKPEPATAVVRYETEPGAQMQVDWACLRGKFPRLSAFVATLGWSRYSFVQIVENEKIENLLSCHLNAFDYFGGIPKHVLYDNAKTIVIKRNAYGEGLHRFHASLWDMAHHYGFVPKLCRPYRPQTKGKVERFIRYLKHNFYYPTESRYRGQQQHLDCRSANVEALKWLRDIANVRVHQTTGVTPKERFEEEQHRLQRIPMPYRGLISTPLEIASHTQGTESLQHDLSVYANLFGQEVDG